MWSGFALSLVEAGGGRKIYLAHGTAKCRKEQITQLIMLGIPSPLIDIFFTRRRTHYFSFTASKMQYFI